MTNHSNHETSPWTRRAYKSIYGQYKVSSFPPWAPWGNTSSHIAAAGSLDTFSSSLRANTSPVISWNFFALHKNVRSRDNKYSVVSYGHWSFSDNQDVAVNFCCYPLEPRYTFKVHAKIRTLIMAKFGTVCNTCCHTMVNMRCSSFDAELQEIWHRLLHICSPPEHYLCSFWTLARGDFSCILHAVSSCDRQSMAKHIHHGL